MDLGLKGRCAAVAAASGGLGYASAAALASEGAHVAICGRDKGRIEEAAARIGQGCVPLVCDVSDARGGAAFIEEATEALGRIDVAVANSGGPPAGNFANTPIEAYHPALDLNLMSVVGMCKAAVPAMRDQGWGRFVAITSVSVRQPMATIILSNTARAGATAFLKTVATEVAADGVTVNTVQPGFHATDRVASLYGKTPDAAALGVPAGVLGDPTHFGALVAFMCSAQAAFLTGVQIHVDGGAYSGLL